MPKDKPKTKPKSFKEMLDARRKMIDDATGYGETPKKKKPVKKK